METVKVHEKVDQLAGAAHRAVDKVVEATGTVGDKLKAQGQDLMATEERLMNSVCDYARERPLATIGIAIAAGFILGTLAKR